MTLSGLLLCNHAFIKEDRRTSSLKSRIIVWPLNVRIFYPHFFAYYKLYLEFDGPNEGSRYHQSKLVIPESETEY